MTPLADDLRSVLARELEGKSTHAYASYIQQLRLPECLGWEAKVAAGTFDSGNLRAHVEAGQWLGKHRAYAEIADRLTALLAEGGGEVEEIDDEHSCVTQGNAAWQDGFNIGREQGRREATTPPPQARGDMVLVQLRRELAEDKGWDYTEYEKGRIAEKQRCISLLAAAPGEGSGQ